MAAGANRFFDRGCCCPLFAGNEWMAGVQLSHSCLLCQLLSNLLGMDWRYGALHFMRHLIDGDCPIDEFALLYQRSLDYFAYGQDDPTDT